MWQTSNKRPSLSSGSGSGTRLVGGVLEMVLADATLWVRLAQADLVHGTLGGRNAAWSGPAALHAHQEAAEAEVPALEEVVFATLGCEKLKR